MSHLLEIPFDGVNHLNWVNLYNAEEYYQLTGILLDVPDDPNVHILMWELKAEIYNWYQECNIDKRYCILYDIKSRTLIGITFEFETIKEYMAFLLTWHGHQ